MSPGMADVVARQEMQRVVTLEGIERAEFVDLLFFERGHGSDGDAAPRRFFECAVAPCAACSR